MKSESQLSNISRFLSLVLRHKPEQISLTLDGEGYADVDFILSKLNISKEELDFVVANNNKSRFSYSEDGTKIRASQGHSKHLNIKIDMKEYIPPVGSFLYHGTSDLFLKNIMKDGLIPMSRQHVHLSKDMETAISVGKRKIKTPTILRIDARRMYVSKFKFKESENGVVLIDAVPPEFIQVM